MHGYISMVKARQHWEAWLPTESSPCKLVQAITQAAVIFVMHACKRHIPFRCTRDVNSPATLHHVYVIWQVVASMVGAGMHQGVSSTSLPLWQTYGQC